MKLHFTSVALLLFALAPISAPCEQNGEELLPAVAKIEAALKYGRWLSEVTSDLFGPKFGIEFKSNGKAIFWGLPCANFPIDEYHRPSSATYSISGGTITIHLSTQAAYDLSHGEKTELMVLNARLLNEKSLYITNSTAAFF